MSETYTVTFTREEIGHLRCILADVIMLDVDRASQPRNAEDSAFWVDQIDQSRKLRNKLSDALEN